MSSAVFPISLAPSIQLRRRVALNGKSKYPLLFAFVILFIALIVQLSVRITILQKSYSIEGLRHQNLVQDRKLRQLRLQYESMSNPQHLRMRAQSELGMEGLVPQQVRHLALGKGIN